jgi:lipopolysaccharide transport system ATP-binding protein
MSSEHTAIRAEGLGKCYRIVQGDPKHTNLSEQVLERLRHPLRRARHENFWALRDVSFDVAPGEVLGIVGRNGAGKSTLLKLLSRITPPTAGRAEMHGRVGSLLEVGTGFHKELTGRENIYLNGSVLGMRRREIARVFDEIVEFSGVGRFLDTPVKRYSSGMYVRLAFAVAAHLQPEILIVDEVLAVGDAEFQKKCLGKMGEVSRSGRTVLFVSHNMNAVLNLCTRAILLEGGHVTQTGSATEVVDAYLRRGRRLDGFTGGRGREGDGRARIVDFEVRPSPPRTGDRAEFLFTVERNDEALASQSIELGLGLETTEGGKVLEMYSRNMGHSFPLREKRTTFSASIDRLPLVPGSYRLNLWAGSGNACIDFVRDAFVLDVDPGALHGDVFAENFGFPVTLPMTWRALEAAPSTREHVACNPRP